MTEVMNASVTSRTMVDVETADKVRADVTHGKLNANIIKYYNTR